MSGEKYDKEAGPSLSENYPQEGVRPASIAGAEKGHEPQSS